MKPSMLFGIVCLAALLAACGDPVGSKPQAKDRPAAPGMDRPDAPGEPIAPPAPGPGTTTIQPGADAERPDGDLDWLDLLKPEDRAAVDAMPKVWAQAISEVRTAGYGADMDDLGAAADPDAALRTLTFPGPGAYACRTIYLGSDRGLLAFVRYPTFDCRVSKDQGGRPLLTKTTGSVRTQGTLYPLGSGRMLFIGGQAFGDERGFPDYGDDYSHDDFGVLEQLGDGHWRIVMPGPRQHQRLELLEIWRWPEV